jgi:hypothetical protein
VSSENKTVRQNFARFSAENIRANISAKFSNIRKNISTEHICKNISAQTTIEMS